ncbi:MAG TPA: hypothetical protein PLN63_00060 [Paludibacteraceae bacterium]|nr:hypothetical protein [Paludibacteraceae bacterium]
MENKTRYNQEADRLMSQLNVSVVFRCGDGLWFTDEGRAKSHGQECGKGYTKYER